MDNEDILTLRKAWVSVHECIKIRGYCVEDCNILIAQPEDLRIDVVDLSTCSLNCSLDLLGIPGKVSNSHEPFSSNDYISGLKHVYPLTDLIACGPYILGYSDNGFFSIAHREKRVGLCTLSKHLIPGQYISSVCAGSTIESDMFFFSVNNESCIYGILITIQDDSLKATISSGVKVEENTVGGVVHLANAGPNNGCNTSNEISRNINTSISSTPISSGNNDPSDDISNPTSMFGKPITNSHGIGQSNGISSAEAAVRGDPGKLKSSLITLTRHPSELGMFVHFLTGGVHILGYNNLRKKMLRDMGCAESDIGELVNSSSAIRKIEALSGRDSPGMGVSTELGFDNDKNQCNASQEFEKSELPTFVHSRGRQELLEVFSILAPPADSHGRYSVVQVAVHFTGSLFAVLWKCDEISNAAQVLISVYDARLITQESAGFLRPIVSTSMTGLKLRFGSIAFHPFEPLILLAGDVCLRGDGGENCRNLYALSLQDASLGAVGSHDLVPVFGPPSEHPQKYRMDCCHTTGRIIISMHASQTVFSCSIAVFSLSNTWQNIHGFLSSPVVTSVASPPSVFVHGDKELAPDGLWPTVLAANPLSSIISAAENLSAAQQGTLLGRPVQIRYNMFNLRMADCLAVASDANVGSSLLGVINVVSTSSTVKKTVNSWCPVPFQDYTHSQEGRVREALFRPQRILHTQTQASASNVFEDYCLLIGSIWRSADGGVSSNKCTRLLNFSPGVCVVRFVDGNAESALTNYRDASFWDRNIIALNSDGLVLKVLRIQPGGLVSTWNLDYPLRSLWPSPPSYSQYFNVLLYVARIVCRSTTSAGHQIEILLLSGIGQPATIAWDKAYHLEAFERVLDVHWQPRCDQSNDVFGFWNSCSPNTYLTGVLTNTRVLLFAASHNRELQLLSSFIHSPMPMPRSFPATCSHRAFMQSYGSPSMERMDPVGSISWVGASLVYSKESGEVGYLLPGKPSPSVGIYGSVAFFPTILSQHGGLRIVCCLPDRIVFASTSPFSKSCGIYLCCRPWLPIEPLLLSIFSLRAIIKDAHLEWSESLRSAVSGLICSYIPAKLVSGSAGESGALPSGQASRSLSLTLHDAGSGFELLSAIVAGISPSSTSYSTEQAVCRWIPVGFKFNAAIFAGRVEEASLELLAVMPELQEPYLDSKSYVDLPHRESAISHLLSQAARLVWNGRKMGPSSEWQIKCSSAACRLADIAGDDELVAEILIEIDKTYERGCCIAQLEELLKALGPHCGATYLKERIRKYLNGVEIDGPSSCDVKDMTCVSVEQLGGAKRRSSVVSLLNCPLDPKYGQSKASSSATKNKTLINHPPASDAISDKSTPKEDQLMIFESQQRRFVDQRQGGLGPPSLLGALAMDRIEDWVGARFQLEVVAQGALKEKRAVAMFGVSSFSNIRDGTNLMEGGSRVFMPDGSEPPVTWVNGVGIGKDWDKLVGYWRFSDVIRRSDSAFSSSEIGARGSRLCILDLSKYSCSSLELFGSDTDSLSLQPSMSNVDPGEDHEKIKTLFDVVYGGRSGGLRVPVQRGGPLDVGMQHVLPERNKITVEFSIALTSVSTDGVCLAQRTVDQASAWKLWLSSDGSLIWSFGEASAQQVQLIAPPGTVIIPPADANADELLWNHIAVVVGGKEGGKHAEVSLYANGLRCAYAASLCLPVFSEVQLSSSLLLFGVDLSRGTRLTELRIWADTRGETELDTQKESYLPLASRRKRLQYRIKGSKRLFSAAQKPEEFMLGVACDSIVVSKVDTEDSADAKDVSSTASSGEIKKPTSLPPPRIGLLPKGATIQYTSLPDTKLRSNTPLISPPRAVATPELFSSSIYTSSPKLTIKVMERLECEVVMSNSVIKSFKLTGIIKCKSESIENVVVPIAGSEKVDLHVNISYPSAHIGEVICNSTNFAVNSYEDATRFEETGAEKKIFSLSSRYVPEFLNGLSPLDLVKYRLAPSFRPLLILTRCMLISMVDSGGSSAKTKLRVEIELNKKFFGTEMLSERRNDGSLCRCGTIEITVHLANLLQAQLLVDEIKSSRVHSYLLEAHTICWKLSTSDFCNNKISLEALLRLARIEQDVVPLETGSLPSSLPVKIGISLPEHIISDCRAEVALKFNDNQNSKCDVMYAAKAEYLFNP